MKKMIKCENCGTENDFFALNCNNCKSYLRARVVNIDFWKILWEMIEAPREAFMKVIFAEHKNLAATILFLVVVKFAFLNISATTFFTENYILNDYFFLNLVLSILWFIFIFFLTSFFAIKIGNSSKLTLRKKDSFSVISYSFIPILISFFILTPLEYSLFGKYMFTFNPSPFVIKENPAYGFLIFESFSIIWALGLYSRGLFVQSNSMKYSVIISLLLAGLLFISLIIIPLYPFV